MLQIEFRRFLCDAWRPWRDSWPTDFGAWWRRAEFFFEPGDELSDYARSITRAAARLAAQPRLNIKQTIAKQSLSKMSTLSSVRIRTLYNVDVHSIRRIRCNLVCSVAGGGALRIRLGPGDNWQADYQQRGRNCGKTSLVYSRTGRFVAPQYPISRRPKVAFWPIATLPQEFMSAMPRERTNPI
jgi:hypothetical protein